MMSVGRSFAGLGVALILAAATASSVWAQFRVPRPNVPADLRRNPVPQPPPQPRASRQERAQPPREAPASTPSERAGRMRGAAPAAAARAASSSSLPEEDQGILNDMHRAHVGQIVFTRQDFSVDAINEAALADSFDLGQPMFFRVYMARSAVNAMLAAPGVTGSRDQVAARIQYRARFTVNGQALDTTFHYFGEIEERNRYTTWRGQFINRNPMSQRLPGSEVLREFVTKGLAKGLLRTGTSARVTMDVVAMVNPYEGNGPPVVGDTLASGSFTLRLPAGVINKADPHICIPQGPRSPAIERAALAQATPSWLARDAQPVSARLSQDAWEVTRNALTSVPIERKTTVLIAARAAEGCYSARYSWTEPFAGNGFSTESGSLAFLPFSRTWFPCSCLD